ncbi:MAG: MotA/TolQ/ExbB proton channel family protein [Ferrovibrio sp.]|uniref:MotA/TolQ/ExbB proton channel family protein n=1 Tax=Ferrovibrio sp. TaxID=1917215 RepID=UPI00260BB60C|nr:MotA/TolQ/ExbB proton channel family protein [Ferrovibrio sp.]MCW0232861.1 MotA/TolQ/ExbB proton channel family protein [Ferrovibrio sp.]
MRRLFPTEFIYQVSALLVSFILVHAAYVAMIRPNAEQFLASEKAKVALDAQYEMQQSVYVILRDYEQEACLVLMFWAFAILGYKAIAIMRQRRQLEMDLVGLPEGTTVSSESAQQTSQLIRKRFSGPEQGFLLARAMLAAIDRFVATRSVQDASTVVHNVCDAEAERQDSQLSIIRYVAWAIPSIGFIGTVRGIGDALTKVQRAVSGDISGVTDSLGVAFNSTLVALLASIVLMFLIHQLQSSQEQLVLDTRKYCDDWFVRRLKV